MVAFWPSEIKKLDLLCAHRIEECESILNSKEASEMEKALAKNEMEWMTAMFRKLSTVIDTKAKRVEITSI